MKALRLIKYTFAEASYEPLELLNIIFLAIYTAGIINPFRDAFSSGAAYNLIAKLMSEQTFGAVCLLVTINCAFAFYNGDLHYRWYATMAASLFWGVVFSALFAANHSLSVGLILIPCGLMSLLPCSRIARDIKSNRIAPWTGHK